MGAGGTQAAVILWMRDGRVVEVVFATRFLAECYLALVPFTVEPDGSHAVAAAMISPRVAVEGVGDGGGRGSYS